MGILKLIEFHPNVTYVLSQAPSLELELPWVKFKNIPMIILQPFLWYGQYNWLIIDYSNKYLYIQLTLHFLCI